MEKRGEKRRKEEKRGEKRRKEEKRGEKKGKEDKLKENQRMRFQFNANFTIIQNSSSQVLMHRGQSTRYGLFVAFCSTS